jgi:hypothetical protein
MSQQDKYAGIELDRWGKGIDHDPRSEELGRAIGEIDFDLFQDSMCLKFGGDGDNGEALMYILDVYFELQDRKLVTIQQKDAEIAELRTRCQGYERFIEEQGFVIGLQPGERDE